MSLQSQTWRAAGGSLIVFGCPIHRGFIAMSGVCHLARQFQVQWDSSSTGPSTPVAQCRKLDQGQSAGHRIALDIAELLPLTTLTPLLLAEHFPPSAHNGE